MRVTVPIVPLTQRGGSPNEPVSLRRNITCAPTLSLQLDVGRVRGIPPPEVAADLGDGRLLAPDELVEVPPVDAVDDVVARRERDDRMLAVGRVGRRAGAGVVEDLRDVGGHAAVADGVEHRLERRIGLAMDVDELADVQLGAVRADVDEAVARPPRRPTPSRRRTRTSGSGRGCSAASSPRGGTGASWYGSPNMTICTPPNGSALRPRAWRSERSMASIRSALTIEISSITSVSIALRILRVGIGLVDLAVRDEPDRQPEQRVDRLPLDVQRGDAGRRADGDLLRRVPGEVLQQRRLAGARAPGDEDVLAGVFDEPEQRLLLGGEGGRGHRLMLTTGGAPPGAASTGVALGGLSGMPSLDWARGPRGGGHGCRARVGDARCAGAPGGRRRTPRPPAASHASAGSPSI